MRIALELLLPSCDSQKQQHALTNNAYPVNNMPQKTFHKMQSSADSSGPGGKAAIKGGKKETKMDLTEMAKRLGLDTTLQPDTGSDSQSSTQIQPIHTTHHRPTQPTITTTKTSTQTEGHHRHNNPTHRYQAYNHK